MSIPVIDRHPAPADMHGEVLRGLAREPKHLPCKYFYDARGARLFDAICQQPEYYPTRTEIQILEQALPALSSSLGPGRWVVEPGSGSGIKTQMLLDALDAPAGYVPIDISKQQLIEYAAELRQRYAGLHLQPICADFTHSLGLIDGIADAVIWFPGSTIGNFPPAEARRLLAQFRQQGGPDSELLIGVDLHKPAEILEAAYNDAAGITADFNRNLLRRINQDLQGEFDLDNFRHQAVWNEELGAIQMFLISERRQLTRINGASVALESEERICTEYSFKYRIEDFRAIAEQAGWCYRAVHTDVQNWFGVFHFAAGESMDGG